ncbi:TPA: hypothetical protein ACKPYB_001208 [Stenotrophomonas maltophilia]|jgi:hypothetical protein|uniref:hypothetical protein n=1 Tax=Stenotrophomonas TaxID=40323 RepID=UPI001AA12906|nr:MULTISPECIES: hypothetical protein [Stenotrophomonas]ELF4107741.1 hypothetical protein [Stenotrophomonas maltophilia]MBO1745491.1 hypothetical protein [Stenotrophomonas maltophilia]WAP03587.1 hypothetical protein FQS62_008925 [Stenotrophomonas sp. SBJS02]HEA4091044.1 hypothetical protein [Stenotrophomonas maltophilia]HEA4094955.1 hypothetical protein [Stenotrophomonas maltophilia]
MSVADLVKKVWVWLRDLFRTEEEVTKEHLLDELKEIIEQKDPKDGAGGSVM